MPNHDDSDLYKLIIQVHQSINTLTTQVERVASGHERLTEKVKVLEGDHDELERLVSEVSQIVNTARLDLAKTSAALEAANKKLLDHEAPIKRVQEEQSFWDGLKSRWREVSLIILVLALLLRILGPTSGIETSKKKVMG